MLQLEMHYRTQLLTVLFTKLTYPDSVMVVGVIYRLTLQTVTIEISVPADLKTIMRYVLKVCKI